MERSLEYRGADGADHAAAVAVVRRLREGGFEALFAGGCVRDLLLGRVPHDYDVATSATADEVQRLFPRTVPVGVQFGVVLVLEGQHQIEVATFRRDGAYLDHRHPTSVEFTDARGDAERRDFTINGMFLDPTTGEIHDFVGGRADLDAGVVRAIGTAAERFEEDRLRLLRAVRFATRFDYEIDPDTAAAIKAAAPTIVGIAWERIGEELIKILASGRADRGFRLLDELGLLDPVLPEISAMKGVEQSPDHHPEGDVFVHTLGCLSHLTPEHGEALTLGVLLHDVSKPECAEHREDGRITFHGHCEKGAERALQICRRLRRSRDVGERTAWLVRNHLRHLDAPRMRVSTLRRFLGEEAIEDLLELVRIDGEASAGPSEGWVFLREKQAEFADEPVRPDPLIQGRDLIELGFRPGKHFGGMLDRAFDAQLEGVFDSGETGRAWVLREFGDPSRGRD